MRGATKIALIVGVVIVFLIGGGLGLRYMFAEPTGATEAREDTQSGSNRIAQYDRFYDLCSSAKTAQDQITNLEEERDAGVSESRADQITASITALKGKRDEAVNKYNSLAQRDYTAGQFRDSDLPYELDGQENISCTAG